MLITLICGIPDLFGPMQQKFIFHALKILRNRVRKVEMVMLWYSVLAVRDLGSSIHKQVTPTIQLAERKENMRTNLQRYFICQAKRW